MIGCTGAIDAQQAVRNKAFPAASVSAIGFVAVTKIPAFVL